MGKLDVKGIASLAVTILVAIVAIWLVFKLVVGVLKLIGIVVIVGLAIAAFYAIKGRIGGPDA